MDNRSEEAIQEVDRKSDGGPAYYMINCAHPSHFDLALDETSGWSGRILGTRANASKMSHEELDACEELDEGNPSELAADHEKTVGSLPNLRILGGCCGTSHEHIAAFGKRYFGTNKASA